MNETKRNPKTPKAARKTKELVFHSLQQSTNIQD